MKYTKKIKKAKTDAKATYRSDKKRTRKYARSTKFNNNILGAVTDEEFDSVFQEIPGQKISQSLKKILIEVVINKISPIREEMHKLDNMIKIIYTKF